MEREVVSIHSVKDNESNLNDHVHLYCFLPFKEATGMSIS